MKWRKICLIYFKSITVPKTPLQKLISKTFNQILQSIDGKSSFGHHLKKYIFILNVKVFGVINNRMYRIVVDPLFKNSLIFFSV